MLKGEKSKKIKFIPSKKEFIKNLKFAVPYIIGVAIIGIILANYNNTYFGSPFNSGYQMERSVDVDTEEVEEGNATINEPSELFFKQYFSLKKESFEKFPRKLSLLFYVMPGIFLCPIALKKWKNPLIISMAVWIILILFIYGSLSWVADWDDHRRTLEDMRYFLPILPAASILGGFSIRNIFKGSDIKKILGIIVIFSLIISSVVVADFQIDNQSIIGGPKQQNPNNPKTDENIEYKQIQIKELNENPENHNNTFVKIDGIIIWKSNDLIEVFEDFNIIILFKENENLEIGDVVTVSGQFRLNNAKLDIRIRENSKDSIEVLEKTKISEIEYPKYNIDTLLKDNENFENYVVNIENATITKELKDNEVIKIKDNSTNEEIVVILDEKIELNENDKIDVHGKFRRPKDEDKEWEINIRRESGDKIKVL